MFDYKVRATKSKQGNWQRRVEARNFSIKTKILEAIIFLEAACQ